jgi:hypothetical protein
MRAPAALLLGPSHLLFAAVAAAQRTTQVHDSSAADSIRFDQPPIAGPAARVFRFLFSGVPQWIQIAGVVVGVLIALTLAVLGWRYRAQIRAWLASRSRAYKIGLATVAVVTVGTVAAVGAWSYNYMMHVNDFCSSCHVMNTAFNRFARSEHDQLECHSCHRQSIFASARELYYWVLDRPDKIPPHAPVPNVICSECHNVQRPDSSWQRIVATAGHKVHFESDSASLKDVLCVACHARDVHRFAPSDQSCAQSGCHEKTEVRLGRMAGIRELHCVTCHEFALPVDERLPPDSTRRQFAPSRPQCFSCHDMEKLLADRGLDKDPHQAMCGACHNPHEQEAPRSAFDSCGSAGCHASADTLTAFHRGLGEHTLAKCGACHEPHSWNVESTSCLSCHRSILEDPVRVRRSVAPAPGRPAPREPRTGGPFPHDPVDDAPAIPALQQTRLAGRLDDPFSHPRHRSVSCTTCHSTRRTHGEVTVRARDDCQACHHAADARAGKCDACHAAATLSESYATTVPMRVADRALADRVLPFTHPQHASLPCGACHGDDRSQSLKISCTGCHTDHHGPRTSCVSCHAEARRGHGRDSHLGCASCHTEKTAAALPPRRQVCLACHREQERHLPDRECASCHLTTWTPGAQ